MVQTYQQRVGAVLVDDTGTQIGGTTGLTTRKILTGDHPQWKAFHLTDDGLFDGDENAIGDYSSGTTQFWYKATEEFVVLRLLVHIEDTTGAASADYGNITSGLTNGIYIRHYATDGTTIKNTLNPTPIKTNADWGANCYFSTYENQGSGNDFVNVLWEFAQAGTPIHLATNERLTALFADDLSGLVTHRFLIQGYYADTLD